MEELFIKIFNMSITAGWLVIAVVLLRLLLNKAPKWIRCAMWAFVAVRLICPVSVESILSLVPSSETIPSDIMLSETPQINSGVTALNSTVNEEIMKPLMTPDVTFSVNPMQIVVFIASVVWISGIAGMSVYMCISYYKVRKSVSEAVHYRDNIWRCDHIDTPFILGILKPRIYIMSSLREEEIQCVIAHEKAHIERMDHIWKLFGFILLTVHWFNPVIWVAYIFLCKDIELACDEKVIKKMNTEDKKMYSNVLINCSAPRKLIAACPLAFGEVGVKERVISVLNYKKPAFWVIVLAILATIVIAVCFLTNPISEKETDYSFVGKVYCGGATVLKNDDKNNQEGMIIYQKNYPLFKVEGKKLTFYTTFNRDNDANSDYTKVGKLKKIELNENNFDKLTENVIVGNRLSPEVLRENNKYAFYVTDSKGIMYYLLEQKDGAIYIAMGDEKEQSFEWICRINQLKSAENIPSKQEIYKCLQEEGEEYALEKLKGYYRHQINDAWGLCEGVYSGLNGEMWFIDDKRISVFYDSSHIVEDIAMTDVSS